MRYLTYALLAVAFCALVAVSAYLLLPVCAVRVPLFSGRLDRCPAPEAAATVTQLRLTEARNADLARTVTVLERELGLLHCPAPPVPTPAAAPAQEPPREIDPEAWAAGDLGLLDGCWILDSSYQTVNDETGERTDYTEWSLCFDAAGEGREEMRATNGARCEGAITGRFSEEENLVITEPENLRCTNDTQIYRRVTTCRLLADGGAGCVVEQPGVGTRDEVRLRRAGDGE